MKTTHVSLVILVCLLGCPRGEPPPAPPGEETPDLSREGTVTAVDPHADLIVISLGEKAGIEERQVFTVHQDGEEIARGAVGKVLEEMSGARILEKSREIRVGDAVRLGTEKVDPEPPALPPDPSGATGPVEGKILAVDPKNRIVIVNIGSNDSVEEGQAAEVRRGDEIVARAVVKSVLSDMSGFRILEQSEEPIAGDVVCVRAGEKGEEPYRGEVIMVVPEIGKIVVHFDFDLKVERGDTVTIHRGGKLIALGRVMDDWQNEWKVQILERTAFPEVGDKARHRPD